MIVSVPFWSSTNRQWLLALRQIAFPFPCFSHGNDTDSVTNKNLLCFCRGLKLIEHVSANYKICIILEVTDVGKHELIQSM